MSRRVEIIMPDAGPLISLAMGGALDTLLLVDVPIRIVDQVLYEVTKSDKYPGAKEVKEFVAAHPKSILKTDTNVGRLAAMEREINPNANQRGLGDAAVAEFMGRLDEYIASDAPVLLVYEDGDLNSIRITHARRVHLIGTREFLVGLERSKLIPSAKEIVDRVIGLGRNPSTRTSEQPADTDQGPSVWLPPRPRLG